MSIEPSNETKTAADTASTLSSASTSGAGGAEEEEELTLVEISPSSSSSSPTTVSSLSPSSRTITTSSTGTGGEDEAVEAHPETTAAEPVTVSAVDSSSESSTVELVEEQPAKEQQQRPQPLLAPVAADVQVAPGDRSPQESRNILPIQSSSSLSTPSSSEEYFDESLTTVSSSTEGALIVSSSNNQLNNNTAIVEQQSVTSAAAATPEQSASQGAKGNASGTAGNSQTTKKAPIEIVQIFPSTKADASSSSSTSSGSSGSSASTESSSSSSPSVSPLAVDQQQQQQQIQQSSPPSTSSDLVQGGPEVAIGMSEERAELLPTLAEVLSQEQRPVFQCRGSSSSPQLKQSSLKKYKSNNKNNDDLSTPLRRVSFPKDAQLITGYLEPIDPWACVAIISAPELIKLYRKSCAKHSSEPLSVITEHIKGLNLTIHQRVPLLSLKDQNLNHGSCEALEEVFKRVQYKSINLSHSGLDDTSASVLFDMIEYYEAANELDFSDNLSMTNKSWLACINMIKKSQALNVLITRGPAISEHHAMNLAKALNTSTLHTLRLEHCELTQRPLATLCNLLKRNTSLKELSLAHNQLTYEDAKSIGSLLRSNYHIQLLDISNNNIGDKGVEFIVTALIDQSIYFKTMQETKRRGEFSFSDLSSSLQSINSNKSYFPYPYQQQSCSSGTIRQHQLLQRQPKQTRTRTASTKKAHKEVQPTSPLETAVPLTPPPTPALPTVSTSVSSDDVFLASIEAQDSSGPPPPEPAAASPSEPSPVVATAAEALTVDDANSTNNDSGINSSVSSDVDQTNSDSSCGNKLDEVEGVCLVVPHSSEEEKHLALMTSTAKAHEEKKVTRHESETLVEVKIEESVVESSNERGNVHDGGGEKQTIELTFDLDDEHHAKEPKKARLAKQDSVLSEFESSMPELKVEPQQVKVDVKVDSVAAKSEKHPMEEDTPEICADYDDDRSLKIVEENLLVDRSINATSVTKEEASTDDSAPVTPLATLKKDELQLRLEKSKQQEEQELDEQDNEAISSTSAPEKIGSSKPLQMVEVEIKDKQQPLSRSLDSTGSGDFDNHFLSSNQAAAFPSERSFSSESLNSETSVDSNDSKSSLKIIESKFAARNGTLERQQSIANREALQAEQSPGTVPCGLQVLVLWNNEITRHSAHTFADLIENTSTLEILNVGCNLLCNEFVGSIKSSLKANNSLTNLGLQAAHLSDNGAKVMAEVIEFGGNSTLQRIDLRNNNLLTTGLDCLNEALKSNKTVTRIDLDDVPRRVVDNSIDVGPEYNRLLNNIRAQCERNKNPPEPSEPISTSIKRVRATHLNPRKISLTCTSIRSSPGTTVGEKHQHHLLDPSKKPGGRLRSPLPSPIPSPIASPVPSPSRNRFQVTRVGESSGRGGGGSTSSLTSLSNNKSTSPSPSSTGSSPTLFFAANSRFRVVTVEEPASSKSSSVSNQRMSSSSSISPSPLAATSGVCSSSAPALSSFDSSFKSTSSPISQHYQSVATNTSSPPVLVQQQPQQQQLTQTHFPPSLSPIVPPTTTITTAAAAATVTPLTPPTPKLTKHTRLPSTSSCTLHDSVISSTSIESPDLEVKRFMTSGSAGPGSGTGTARAHSSTTMDDSCCSSISSSIDSIDRVLQFNNNTSISSTDESFDLIVSSPSSSSLSVGSVSTAPLVKTASLQQEDSTLVTHQQPATESTPMGTAGNTLLVQPTILLGGKDNSLSSLDISTSSQESLYDVQDLSLVSVSSGGSSSLVGGGACVKTATCGNSNESTLTSVQGLEKDNEQKQAAAAAGKLVPSEKPPRVRKTSWIASIGGHPKVADSSTFPTGGSNIGSGSAYSPAVEKLLAIFSPSNLFSSNKSSPPCSECGTVPVGSAGNAGTAGKENSTSASHPPARKESPMGGLFRWTTKSSSTAKDEEKVLKVNISPENTITPQMQAQGHLLQQHSPQSAAAAYNVDNIPSQLKAEIKENISPENTITNSKLLINPSPSPTTVQHVAAAAIGAVPAATATVVPTHPKVIFHLGDDYDESEDDIDTLTSKFGGGKQPSSLLGTSTGSTTTNSSGISIGSATTAEGSPGTVLMNTSHLGQLARDSLVTMFKNPALASQDSIRSMDSLTELATVEAQQQQPKPATEDTQAQ